MTVKIDIHNAKRRTERAKTKLQKKFSENNAKISCRFLDRLRLDNKSYGRIANYAECIGRILEIKDSKDIGEWTREEVEFIHKTIADSNYENSVKKDTLTALKRICHFAVHDEIADKSKGKEYDPLVAWITPGSFQDKYQKIQSKDLLTDDDVLQLIQATKRIGGKYVKRNIAIIFVLLEGAYRPGELLDIRIGGIEFEKDFVRIHTTGKTGPKSLTLVASFVPIKEWLAEHPYGDDPDAFLFYHDNADGLIPYQRLSELIKNTRRISGIKKRIWPYLFRHTALTEYSKKLGNVAKIYGNWSSSSNMLAVYEHLANSDQEDAILKLHGLKKDDTHKSILFSKSCPNCHEQNSSDKHHCIRCGKELSEELVKIKEAKREATRKSTLHNFETMVSERIGNLESLFVEQQKLIQSLLTEKKNG
ncbi:MAG: hypothetical protein CO032_00520 [Nitrosopumilales archaeon CG_4_9_14_0_2_um_filter_34_16]|nr:MAG: hypothetical protein CO032_00520 [Nitrosopumilales archaeon CG_4_9_14_0_2_um_filter_34_16]